MSVAASKAHCARGQRLRSGGLKARAASPLEVILVVVLGDKLERDPYKGLNLLALDELDRSLHRTPPLTRSVLEDRHSQVALLHQRARPELRQSLR